MTPRGFKRCSGCREIKPATREHFYKQTASKDGLQGGCIPCFRSGLGTPRSEQAKGVYLAVEKLGDGTFIIKIGMTGDGARGFRSRAGELASEARRNLGIDVVHAEIVWVIEEADSAERHALEKLLLERHTALYADEYFDPSTYDDFRREFEALGGEPFTDRTTYAARLAEFEAYLYAEATA